MVKQLLQISKICFCPLTCWAGESLLTPARREGWHTTAIRGFQYSNTQPAATERTYCSQGLPQPPIKHQCITCYITSCELRAVSCDLSLLRWQFETGSSKCVYRINHHILPFLPSHK